MTNTLTCTRQQASWNWNKNLSYTQRVAYALTLTKYAAKDANGYIKITHEDIAGFVGVSRTNVTAAINRLQNLGLIDKQFGKIKVSDIDMLNDFVDTSK